MVPTRGKPGSGPNNGLETPRPTPGSARRGKIRLSSSLNSASCDNRPDSRTARLLVTIKRNAHK